METKTKKGNTPVLIICAVLFLILWFVQGRMNGRENPAIMGLIENLQGISQRENLNLDSVIGPLKGMSRGGSSVSGIIAQLQVMISAILVLTNKKRGFITAVILNVFNLGFITLFSIVLAKNFNALPGVAVALCTLIISGIIYYFTQKTDKMHEELTKSYEQAIENNRIIQEKDEVLSYLAYYDRLTQMPNRHSFMENLEERIASGGDCTIIYIDIDNFKIINDTFGHSTGDELLVQYANRIEALCGENNFAAKIGGDEFGIILHSGYSSNDIINFVAQLQSVFSDTINLRGDDFSLTASFGTANFPSDARSTEDLFRAAESAMFSAKANGKNQLCFYRRNA
ncbi:MAG: GGDEF domain-containing protein [Ruminococcus sp.]|nr:GGDEF domain-containing protein [Ruminococcus sp.]